MDFRRCARYRRIALAVTAAVVALAGCRQNHASRELLERELRLQEDRIYELESKLEDAERALSQVRDCAPPRSDSWGGDRSGDGPSKSFVTPPALNFAEPSVTLPGASTSPGSSGSSLSPPSITLPPAVELPSGPSSSKSSAPPFRGPPAVVPVDPSVPEGIPARPLAPPSTGGGPATNPGVPALKPMSSPKFLSPSLKPKATDRAESSAPPPNVLAPSTAASRSGGDVRSITLGRRTGGLQLDSAPGDDGVLVVIEARNARGEATSARAAASLVLIDPAVPGEGGRYARWDLDADDVEALFRTPQGSDEAGTYFELPWPDGPPAHTRLKLFVRMTTDDGRQLQAERDVVVELGAAAAQMPSTAGPVVTANANVAADRRAAEAVPAGPATSEPLRWGRTPNSAEASNVPNELPLPIREAEAASGPLLLPASR